MYQFLSVHIVYGLLMLNLCLNLFFHFKLNYLNIYVDNKELICNIIYIEIVHYQLKKKKKERC